MVCVYCDNPTNVINSRRQRRSNTVWRRRQCSNCQSVFSSIEAVDYGQAFAFQRSSHLEPFSRDKLFLSLYDSLRHRKSAVDEASALTDTIINKSLADLKQAAISREHLIIKVYAVLRRFDKAAAIHYQAFHQK